MDKEKEKVFKRHFDNKWNAFLDFEKRKYDCCEIIVRPEKYGDILLKYEHGYLQINIPKTIWEKLRKITEPRSATSGISRIE